MSDFLQYQDWSPNGNNDEQIKSLLQIILKQQQLIEMTHNQLGRHLEIMQHLHASQVQATAAIEAAVAWIEKHESNQAKKVQ